MWRLSPRGRAVRVNPPPPLAEERQPTGSPPLCIDRSEFESTSLSSNSSETNKELCTTTGACSESTQLNLGESSLSAVTTKTRPAEPPRRSLTLPLTAMAWSDAPVSSSFLYASAISKKPAPPSRRTPAPPAGSSPSASLPSSLPSTQPDWNSSGTGVRSPGESTNRIARDVIFAVPPAGELPPSYRRESLRTSWSVVAFFRETVE
mmetsp:Transcript_15070/g.45990  ORF Transcript_15070/g.45990 Transcript_15070/m.45990 type:complete len:206 (-) Transcript_15070:355-972(-)